MEVDAVSFLELAFSELVLFSVMIATKADRPFVGGFEADSSIGTGADVGAFDGGAGAARNRAMVAADPRPVG